MNEGEPRRSGSMTGANGGAAGRDVAQGSVVFYFIFFSFAGFLEKNVEEGFSIINFLNSKTLKIDFFN